MITATIDVWWTNPEWPNMMKLQIGEFQTFHNYDLTPYALVLIGKDMNCYHPWHTIARVDVTKS